jgi:uncharacterized protein YdeI (YjbR/CyaY-like superfamily)
MADFLSRVIDAGLDKAMDNALKRTINRPKRPMPDAIRNALESRNLMGAYDARPPYQRNDYLAWIARARQPETQQKRLETMLRELASGSGYMGQKYKAKPVKQVS